MLKYFQTMKFVKGENMVNKKLVESPVSIPIDITKLLEDKDNLPNPDKLLYYNDLNNRVIYLDDEICREVIVPLIKLIVAWNREDVSLDVKARKPIKIMIDSYGGDIDATLHLIDMIKLSKTPIYTYNISVAMSGGFYIFIAGHKRFALKHSQALCHQGSAGFEGEAETIKSHTTQYNKTLNQLFEHVLESTKISKDLLNKKKKTEWFINGEEQVDLGIADEIITNIDYLI